MGYRCGNCRTTTPPASRPTKVVVETRERNDGGWEVARELALCPDCVAQIPPAVPKRGGWSVQDDSPLTNKVSDLFGEDDDVEVDAA